MQDISLITQMISELSKQDKRELFNQLSTINFGDSDQKHYFNANTLVDDAKFNEEKFCVKCGIVGRIVKFGKVNGVQRYRCKDCGATFVATAKTIFFRNRISFTTVRTYLQCMLHQLSIRKTARECGISLKTAFLWRHKILDALKEFNDRIKLSGIVEADETFYDVDFKGNPTNHLRYWGKSRFELLQEWKENPKRRPTGLQHKVCICCGVDHDQVSYAKCTNISSVRSADLHNAFDGKIIGDDTVLCTDKHPAYVVLAEDNDLNLMQFKGDKLEAKTGVFNIQRINNYHHSFRLWLKPFLGVASKYFDNYLKWNNFMFYSKQLDSVDDLLKYLINAMYVDLMREIQKRPMLPATFTVNRNTGLLK